MLRRLLITAVALAAISPAGPAEAAVTRTTLATLDASGNRLSAAGGVIAVAYSGDSLDVDPQGAPWDRRLRISQSGGPFVVAESSQPIALWAQPHVGTDEAGRPVVIYPTCADDHQLKCDLRVYDVEAQTDRPLTAVNTVAGQEMEGVMDRGAILFAREYPPGTVVDRQLFYLPVGGPRRKVVEYWGSSSMIDLDRGRILVGEDADEVMRCGKDIRLARVAHPGVLRPVAGPRCRSDLALTHSVLLSGDYVYWLRESKAGNRIQRRSVFGGRVEGAEIAGRRLSSFAVESPSTVLAVQTGREDTVVRIDGLRWTAAR